jgi:tRNA threonylcarbamoyladenosine biosynthesis protein TsaB
MSTQVILAIETAINGGSIALLRSGETLYRKADQISRAAELIGAIDVALTSVNISSDDLHMIAVSTGPGSFTGIRVGISTALGLARSLEIAESGISLFDAIAFSNPMDGAAVVIPLGRGRFGVQSFPCDGSVAKTASVPTSMIESELSEMIFKTPSSKFLIYGDEDLFVGSETMSRIPPNVSFIDENLAVLIAKRAINLELPGELSPIYLSR